MVANLCHDTLFSHVAVRLLWWTQGQFKRHHIHQGGALSGKWLCDGKLTPAIAIKVVVRGGSLSTMLRDGKLRWESDGEDKNYRGIGAWKWVLRMLLTREHAGILPNQSNPPKLTPLVRRPMMNPCAPHPWLSPEGAPKRESVVRRFFLTDILKITQMVLHTVQYLSTGGTLPSIKSVPVKLHILHFITMCVLNWRWS